MSKRKSTTSKGSKRVRTDTFSQLSPEEITSRVKDIISGNHKTYKLNKTYISKKDSFGSTQDCWCVTSNSSNCVKQLWSIASYRSFYVWWVYDQKKDTIENLKKVDVGGPDKCHHGHRCDIDDCCNPDHIRIISRTENEVDKHWHFFLNGDKRDQFMALYSDELKQRHIW